ncbi:MAG: BBP7 family outer membrane beta-barrel protein [Pirellulales bacterium]
MMNVRLSLLEPLTQALLFAAIVVSALSVAELADAGGYTHVGGQTVSDAKGRTYYVPECTPACEHPPNWNLYWFNCASPVPGPCDSYGWIRPTNTPTWYAGAEMVAYRLHADDDIVFARYGSDAASGQAGAVAVSTDNFDPDFSGGVRAFIGRQLGDWYRVEASYTGGLSWEEAYHLRDDTPNSLGGVGTLTTAIARFGDSEVAGLDYNDFVSVALRTEMDTVEINLRRKVAMPTPNAETSFLVGLRLSQIGENFGYRSFSNVPPVNGAINELAIDTDNDMVGVQLGMLGQFLDRSRIWVDFEIKGSINHNQTSQSTSYTYTDNNNVTMSYLTSRDESRTTFTGEISLAANCNFTRTLTLRGGYNVLWVGGLALAEENIPGNVTDLTAGPGTLFNDGELFFHGPFLGLTWVH